MTDAGSKDDRADMRGDEPVRVHVPVMLRECLAVMDLAPGLSVVDGTVGGGGHAKEFASAITPGGRVFGLDRDEEILRHAERALRAAEDAAQGGLRVTLHHRPYAELARVLDQEEFAKCDRVFLDLGVSSLQLDTSTRGFTFMHDAPLDMRMDGSSGRTAAEWLRRVGKNELERVLRDYGEERFARRIADRILETRRRHRIERTQQLVDVIAGALPAPARRQRIHFATRSFQAIRIAVNDELGQLERGLEAAKQRLAVGGRLVVLTFHSIEDRIVKQFLRSSGMELPFKKPLVASPDEVAQNPRSRSAKLRCGIQREEVVTP